MVSMPSPGSAPSIQEIMAGIGFPVNKDALIAEFQDNGASELIVNALRAATKTQFTSADDVMDTLRSASPA